MLRRAGGGGAAEPDPEALLRVGSPCEVLVRIVPGDPLELRARVAARLETEVLLVDPERVLLRAQVLCALAAPAWRGAPELGAWLDQRVELALAALRADDAAVARGEEPAAPDSLAAPLALDARALAAACARFNALAREQREAFRALVLDGRAPDRLARERGLSLGELARRARAGLEALRPAYSSPPPTGGP